MVEETGDRDVDAIRGCAGDVIDARFGLEHAQWYVEGERITRATSVAIRRHDRNGHVGKGGESVSEAADAFCAEAVVVTDKYLHGGVWSGCVRANEAATILEPISAEVA